MGIGVSNLREFGNQIREARESYGITITEAAKRASISPPAARNIERGTGSINIRILDRYAKVIGVRVELYVWSNTRNPNETP